MSATYIGPALSDNINHAAPTTCMNAPMSLTTLASSRLRNTGTRSGRHKLGFTLGSWLATLKVCRLRRNKYEVYSRISVEPGTWEASRPQPDEVSIFCGDAKNGGQKPWINVVTILEIVRRFRSIFSLPQWQGLPAPAVVCQELSDHPVFLGHVWSPLPSVSRYERPVPP